MDKNCYMVARELLIVKKQLNQMMYYCEKLESRIESLESRERVQMIDKSIDTIVEVEEEIEEEPPRIQTNKQNNSEEDLEIIELLKPDTKKNVRTWSRMIGMGF
jgi:hypothetical protein